MYYNSHLHLKLIDVKYLHEYISFELRIRGKTCKFLSLYRHVVKTEKFFENLELSIDHMADRNQSVIRYMMVVLVEGSKIDILTASSGFNQIVN